MERDEKRFEYCVCCSSEENSVEEDKEGGIGVVDVLVAPKQWALEAEAEVDEPLRFFDDSSIWWSFCRLQSVKSNEKWKKKKIASYGSRFDEEMSKVGRFEGLGMEGRRKEEEAAQGFLKNVVFIDQDAL